ncbi:IspD/TarI family cytidylyltransferase [Egicoccus halophilus]|uniref:2-C-methyl-D-erythritol 4-phosphate cytidylyltransferase n=1 Tax=Egicoccus halophilus TaxID=1670830 RepID=A0A8J3A9G2_9ACTN|nr:2-C-methyl-D-erythritol 4-phosphate cytidylyltransferase [Egicoccus halophilus]GGI05370.1 hypothetical protein GCM10011354_13760 [Egicoccus halophilus]
MTSPHPATPHAHTPAVDTPAVDTAAADGPVWAVVLAGGSGSRFGRPKQFVTVAGHRLVDLALAAVRDCCDGVVLVLPPGADWDGAPVDAVVTGGPDRPASVRNGLAAVPAHRGVVVVHQAANPLADAALVERLVRTVRDGADAAVPGLRPGDLVRRTRDGRLDEVVGRDELVLVQTPAAFRNDVLRRAHAAGATARATASGPAGGPAGRAAGGAAGGSAPPPALEDTALVTAIGHDVVVVPGDPRNVHVVTPHDLDVVAALLARDR